MGDPLRELFHRLRAARFPVGPDQYLRMRQLGAVAGDEPPEHIKTLLAPIFAGSKEQQGRFYEIFDEVFTPPAPVIEVAPTPRPIGRATALALAAAALVIVALLAVLHSEKEKLPPQRPPPVSVPTAPSRYTVVTRTRAWTRAALSVPMIAGVGAAVLVIAVLAAIAVQEFRRRRRKADREGEEPPYTWSMKAPRLPQLFDPVVLLRLIRALKGREEGDRRRLHIRKSIAATIRADGDPRLVYQSELETPHYVALVEKVSDGDHQAAFFDRLVSLLSAEGVSISRFYYDGDPLACWSESRQTRFQLHDLRSRSPEARLLIFSDPRALLDPLSGGIHRGLAGELKWRRQIAVSLAPVSRSVVDELRARVEVASGPDALERLAELASEGGPRIKREPIAGELLSAGAQRWLRACAAYPRLEWDLTLALGSAILGPAVAAVIAEIVSMPAFRRGVMKNAERLTLVAELSKDPELEQTARGVISKLLLDADLPLGSFAARERNLQLLAQETWLKRHSPSQLAAVYERLRQYRTSEIGGDAALLRLLYAAPDTRFLRRIPGRLRRLWFRSGIPALGHHDLTATMAGLLVLMVLLAVTPWNLLPQTAAGAAVTETYSDYQPLSTTHKTTATAATFTGNSSTALTIAGSIGSDTTDAMGSRSSLSASGTLSGTGAPSTTTAMTSTIASSPAAADLAREKAAAEISRAVEAKALALKDGAGKRDLFLRADQKLNEAVDESKKADAIMGSDPLWHDPGQAVDVYQNAAGLAVEAKVMFVIAREASRMNGTEIPPATPAPTPQPQPQPAAPCVLEAFPGDNLIHFSFAEVDACNGFPEPKYGDSVDVNAGGKLVCRGPYARSMPYLFEITCSFDTLQNYQSQGQSLSVSYGTTTVPLSLEHRAGIPSPAWARDDTSRRVVKVFLSFGVAWGALLNPGESLSYELTARWNIDAGKVWLAFDEEFGIHLDANDISQAETIEKLVVVINGKLRPSNITLTFVSDKGKRIEALAFELAGPRGELNGVADKVLSVPPGKYTVTVQVGTESKSVGAIDVPSNDTLKQQFIVPSYVAAPW